MIHMRLISVVDPRHQDVSFGSSMYCYFLLESLNRHNSWSALILFYSMIQPDGTSNPLTCESKQINPKYLSPTFWQCTDLLSFLMWDWTRCYIIDRSQNHQCHRQKPKLSSSFLTFPFQLISFKNCHKDKQIKLQHEAKQQA